MIRELKINMKDFSMDSDCIFVVIMIIIAGTCVGLMIGTVIGREDKPSTTDYTYVDFDGGNITFRLEQKSYGWTYSEWDLTYKLNNKTTYEYNITKDLDNRGFVNQSAGWDMILKIEGIGTKADLNIWVRNTETGFEEIKRVMHHSGKLKN